MNELVSIITPTYNAEKFIKYTIESVLCQDYENWELIIIDDCSKDTSREIVEEYMKLDKRIKMIALTKNSGVANARNNGINNAKGRYIAFLDSDDLWYANKLSIQISFMKREKCAFSYTGYEWINEDGAKLGKLIEVPTKINYNKLLRGNLIGCLTVIIDKEKIKNIEMPLIRHEDYAAWLNILKTGVEAYGINENLALYRRTLNSLSSNKIKTIFWTWNIFRNSQDIRILKSIIHMIQFIFTKMFKYVT